MQCWGGRGEVWERAQRLHEKMKTNLNMARDRLQFLGEALVYLFYFSAINKERDFLYKAFFKVLPAFKFPENSIDLK